MPLKATLDSLDGVPEALHEHYTKQADGTFRLAAEGVEFEEDVQGLKSALAREKEERRKAKERLEQLGDVDAEEYRRLKEEAEERETNKLKDKGEFEKLREKMTEKHTAELQAKAAEIAKRDQFIERLLIDNKLDAAMTKVDVLPEYREAVKALLKSRGPKVIADGDDYRAVVPTDMGEAEVSTYVEEWSRTDEAAAFLKAKGVGGSGATGGRGGTDHGVNPWKKETRNLTEQMRIAQENPDLAKRLAAQAGVPISL